MLIALIISILFLFIIVVAYSSKDYSDSEKGASASFRAENSFYPSTDESHFAASPTPQKTETLDEKYAKEHQSWICPRCETIISNDSSVCPVCGYQQ